MNTTATILDYHERTKHHPNRYAASLGYMDWATQPDPFRTYEGSQKVLLPLCFENSTPLYTEVMQEKVEKCALLTLASISQLLQFSLGIAAWKCMGSDCWALRCNASSGNLQPTEATLILPPVEGISQKSVIAHYHVKTHALEILAEFQTDYWETSRAQHYFVALSSIPWREMWKYGERAFRYVNLDLGHAQQALHISAKVLGHKSTMVQELPLKTLERLMGLDQAERYHASETEISQLLLTVGDHKVQASDLLQLIQDLPQQFQGEANLLSPSHHPWEAVALAIKATQVDPKALETSKPTEQIPRVIQGEMDAKTVILNRRSAQAMDFARTTLTFSEFQQLLDAVHAPLQSYRHAVNFVLFIHDVETLQSGLYFYIRNREDLSALKRVSRKDFLYQEVAPDLFLLEAGDFRAQSKFISCSQDIASDGAFSLGMIARFEENIKNYGAYEYKRLYWECGALGQQLYLDATALGLSATGIGCYLDDVMHRMLGLSDNTFQTLYHFTIGRAIIDTRMSMRKPYEQR